MKVIHKQGNENLATVYIARTTDGSRIEFVESVQPPVPRDKKWVLIISTLKGCPAGCPMCDAGGHYHGKLTEDELWFQIEYLIKQRYPLGAGHIPKLKIQFARMGDPAFNMNVVKVLEEIPSRLKIKGIMPSISTIAPKGTEDFFEKLLQAKKLYPAGHFQMQFSIHATDLTERRKIIPVKTWSFEEMAAYGKRFHEPGDRKITLNFAPVAGFELDPEKLRQYFSPEIFIIKLTPVNPTYNSEKHGLRGLIDPDSPETGIKAVNLFKQAGYDTILSIGETEENIIGSNCGMFVTALKQNNLSAKIG